MVNLQDTASKFRGGSRVCAIITISHPLSSFTQGLSLKGHIWVIVCIEPVIPKKKKKKLLPSRITTKGPASLIFSRASTPSKYSWWIYTLIPLLTHLAIGQSFMVRSSFCISSWISWTRQTVRWLLCKRSIFSWFCAKYPFFIGSLQRLTDIYFFLELIHWHRDQQQDQWQKKPINRNSSDRTTSLFSPLSFKFRHWTLPPRQMLGLRNQL